MEDKDMYQVFQMQGSLPKILNMVGARIISMIHKALRVIDRLELVCSNFAQ